MTPPNDAWRSIESAPRDGSWFVTANAECPGEYEIGRYEPMTWRSYVDAGNGLFKAVDTPVSEFTHDNFRRATHWFAVPTLFTSPAPEPGAEVAR